MALFLTKCPATGKTVSTGQYTMKRGSVSGSPASGSFRCGACGQVHEWTLADAWPKPVLGATSLK